jgi:hypothetical protein
MANHLVAKDDQPILVKWKKIPTRSQLNHSAEVITS